MKPFSKFSPGSEQLLMHALRSTIVTESSRSKTSLNCAPPACWGYCYRRNSAEGANRILHSPWQSKRLPAAALLLVYVWRCTTRQRSVLARVTGPQQEKFAEEVVNAGKLWTLGFSEPGSGSHFLKPQATARRIEGGYSLEWGKVFCDQCRCCRLHPDELRRRGLDATGPSRSLQFPRKKFKV